MIQSMTGNLLEDTAESYVNTVNTVGAMGKGHYNSGYGDRTTASKIYLLDEAKEQAEMFSKVNKLAQNYLEQVSGLFYGFETPFG